MYLDQGMNKNTTKFDLEHETNRKERNDRKEYHRNSMIFAQLNAIKNDIYEKVNGVVYTSGAQTISLLFLIWTRRNERNMQSQWTGKCYGT